MTGLKPGRRYAVRVSAKPIVTDPDVVVSPGKPSDALVVCTPATPPIAPAAPGLASRLRNTMKVGGGDRWKLLRAQDALSRTSMRLLPARLIRSLRRRAPGALSRPAVQVA